MLRGGRQAKPSITAGRLVCERDSSPQMVPNLPWIRREEMHGSRDLIRDPTWKTSSRPFFPGGLVRYKRWKLWVRARARATERESHQSCIAVRAQRTSILGEATRKHRDRSWHQICFFLLSFSQLGNPGWHAAAEGGCLLIFFIPVHPFILSLNGMEC